MRAFHAGVVPATFPNDRGGDIAISDNRFEAGEKLYGEMLIEGAFEPTPRPRNPRIMRINERPLPMPELQALLRRLERACQDGGVEQTRALLAREDISYVPDSEIMNLQWSEKHHAENPVEIHF